MEGKLEVLTMAELCAKVDAENRALKKAIKAGTQRWGRWRYNKSAPPSIDIGNYDIVLHRIDSVAKLGKWLMHLREKSWVTADDLGNLVVAVDDLIRVGLHHITGRGFM